MSSTSRAGRHDPSACLSIYDGTIMAGFVVVRGQRFHVFGAGGEPIGVFDDLRSAVRAAPHPIPRFRRRKLSEEPPTSCLRSAIPRAHDER